MIIYDVVVLTLNKEIPDGKMLPLPSARSLERCVVSFIYCNAGQFRLNAARRPPMFPINLWNMFHRTDT